MTFRVLLKNLSWQTMYEAISSVIGFIFYITLARTLGERGVGSITYLIAFFGFILLALDLGTSSFYIRKWSSDLSQYRKDLEEIWGLKLYSLAPICLLLFFYTIFFEKSLQYEFFLSFIAVLLFSILKIPLAYLTSQNEFKLNFYISFTERFFSLGVSSILLLFHFGVVTVLWFFIISKVVALFISQRYVNFLTLPTLSFIRVRTVFIKSIPLLAMTFLFNLYFRIDAVILEKMVNTEALGLYSSAYRIFEAVLVIPSLFSVALTPIVAKLYAKQQHPQLVTFLQYTLLAMCTLSFFILAFFFSYSSDILTLLYGSGFAVASPAMIVLSVTLILIFANLIFSTFIYLDHQEKYLLVCNGATAVVNIALNILIIPYWGITGAAITTLVCELMMSILLIFKIRLYFPIFPFIKLGVIGLLFGIVIHTFHLPLFEMFFISGLSYLLVLFLLKIFPFNELLKLVHTNK